jgi:hypothetical protein
MIRFSLIGFILMFASESFAGNLIDTTNQADYIVIAPNYYYPVAEQLALFRHQKNGFSTMVVSIDTIAMDFGFATPDTALKDFIQFTLNHWSNPKPQYFVLAGNINVIPSHPEADDSYEIGLEQGALDVDFFPMIDQWFVEVPRTDFTSISQTNACIGRFPAWDSASLAIMVDKTIQYESDSPGAWCNRAISVADYREDDGTIFEDDARTFRVYLDSLWTDTIAVDVRSDSPNYLDTTAFVNLWNQGAAVVSYFGHADAVQLSNSRYFTTWAIDSLTNNGQLPVCLFGGCDLTYDTGPDVSIPTHLLAREGGGAVAVVSSEGLSYENTATTFFTSMVQSMIKKPDEPIGKSYEEAVTYGMVWGDYLNTADRYTFLGDPALTIKHSVITPLLVSNPARPSSFVLEQNFPNPFNPTTVITYELPGNASVSLKVYDMLGREVRSLVNEPQSAGSHSVTFNAGGLASGVYLYRLQAGSCTATKKLLLLK